jgi:hypothetical protein
MGLKEIWYGDVDWIEVVQDRTESWALMITIINLRVPKERCG